MGKCQMIIMRKSSYLIFYFMIILMISCNSQYKSFKQVKISIPEHLNITETDILNKIPEKIIDESSNYDLELTVFAFSGGSEKINYTGDDNFVVSLSEAYIKILVKVIKDNEIVKTRIIEAAGKDKFDAIESAVKKLGSELS